MRSCPLSPEFFRLLYIIAKIAVINARILDLLEEHTVSAYLYLGNGIESDPISRNLAIGEYSV